MRIYTDGSCLKNPGPGGWAYALCNKEGIHYQSGLERNTTNNRMELLAVTKALEDVLMMIENKEIEDDEVTIVSDSAYVVNAIIKGWILKWKMGKWKTSKGDDVKNRDLWERIDRCINCQRVVVKFEKVKGHSGDNLNELVDKIARDQSKKASEME